MAVESPDITATAVESMEFPDLVRRYRVNGVPKTVADSGAEVLGAQPEPMFVSGVLAGRTAPPAPTP